MYYSPLLFKISPCFRKIQQLFTYFTCNFPPTLTMMHLCITHCTYWTPLTGLARFKTNHLFYLITELNLIGRLRRMLITSFSFPHINVALFQLYTSDQAKIGR